MKLMVKLLICGIKISSKMRPLFFLFTFLFSSFCFAQNTGQILGNVLDGESFNEPLIFANIAIKGSSMQASTDENGLFYFENLADGNYTLVISFTGYESKKMNINVNSSKQTGISISLQASSISLNDLASLNSPTKLENKTFIAITN